MVSCLSHLTRSVAPDSGSIQACVAYGKVIALIKSRRVDVFASIFVQLSIHVQSVKLYSCPQMDE